MASNSLLESALEYARRGWPVFPLHNPVSENRCSCGRDECTSKAKHPRTKNGLKDATTDEAQIRLWWQQWPHANIGLPTGAASFVVIDIDPRHGGDDSIQGLFEEFGRPEKVVCAKTGSGGEHLLFAHPGFKVKNNQSSKIGQGIDVRGDGGYIVAAPSRHVSGGFYRWAVEPNGTLPELPLWIVEIMKREPESAPAILPDDYEAPEINDKYVQAAFENEIAAVSCALEGSRNQQLNDSAFALGQFVAAGVLQRSQVEQALEYAASKAGLAQAEIRATVRSGLNAGARQPRQIPEPKRAAQVNKPKLRIVGKEEEGDSDSPRPPLPPSPFNNNGKVSIDVTINHLPTMNALCWQAIQQCNQPPILFLYGGQVIRTVRNPDGTVLIQPVTAEILRHHLAEWAHWHKANVALAKPPIDVVKDVLATKDIPLPTLTRIVHVPVFSPSGALQTEAGFDSESGVLYSPLNSFTALSVPDCISDDDVANAKTLIDEMLTDFPFATDADKHNAIALFLLPFAREMIAGPTPNHLIEASMPGSGKGMLANALLFPSIGRDMGLTTQPRDDDEWRKKITSMLIEGKPSILIDNVSRMLDSGTLAAAITGEIWSERILGQNSTTQIKIRCCWVTTGNNITISTELARRSIRIRLVPKTDRPEDRQNFLHSDLLDWVEQNRARLVWAAHVLIKRWIQEGRSAAKNRPLGSFERWSKVMGGVLTQAGLGEFLANSRDFQSRSDTERQARSLFCATWFEWMEKNHYERCSVSDLLHIADGVDGLSLRGATDKARQVALGMYLKSSEEMVIDFTGEDENGQTVSRKFQIERAGQNRGKQMWKINLVSDCV